MILNFLLENLCFAFSTMTNHNGKRKDVTGELRRGPNAIVLKDFFGPDRLPDRSGQLVPAARDRLSLCTSPGAYVQ
ncbi:MAG: hypothetical protein DMG89_08900 [Acidobacteria bacterium]|nr:MAG: hypothetical protein DMG89_08900 [Acidobacteriota bacterium]